MRRSRKLLIVGLVLVVGFGLAWPFRKTTPNKTPARVAKTRAVDFDPAMLTNSLQASVQQPQMGSPEPQVVAKMTSMNDPGISSKKSLPIASFDLANHPALTTSRAPRVSSPVTPPTPPYNQKPIQSYLPAQVQNFPARVQQNRARGRPVYAMADHDLEYGAQKQHPSEIRHVVQNSDTLEKLAKRYLGDEGRAMEIFDLNRDLLDNPHLLPINAQLRIPPGGFRNIHLRVD